MQNNYLSYSRVLKGKILNLLEKPLSSSRKDDRFIKSFTDRADSKVNYTVDLCRDKGKEVIVKRLAYKNKNLKYEQIRNEAALLSLMMELHDNNKESSAIVFPKLVKLEEKDHEIILEREYIRGKMLKDFSREKQVKILKICLDSLSHLSAHVYAKNAFTKRTIPLQILSLPLYLALAILKEPKMSRNFLPLAFRYYFERLGNWKISTYILAHRDLHPNNILVYTKNGKERIAIIDSEIAVVCEPQTDLAIIARYYLKDLGFNNLYKLLSSQLRNNSEKKSFISNSIFYAIQCIAIENKSDKFYENSKNYCTALLHHLPEINNIIRQKVPQRAGFWPTIVDAKNFLKI